MSAQVYCLPGQTEGGRKAFLGWKSTNLWSKLSLTCGGNVNCYKSVHHPIPTCGNREHPGNFQNKSVGSPFNWVSSYILFSAKLKRRGRPFLKDARWRATLWGYHQEHLVVIGNEKVSPCVKFRLILSLLFLLESLATRTKKHCRTWSSVINFWIDSRICKK